MSYRARVCRLLTMFTAGWTMCWLIGLISSLATLVVSVLLIVGSFKMSLWRWLDRPHSDSPIEPESDEIELLDAVD